MKLKKLIFALFLLLVVVAMARIGIEIYEKNANKNSLSSCAYNDSAKSYIHKAPNCTINFMCTTDKVPFSDECGCGCMPKENATESKIYCTPEQKTADVCFEIYQPVCGWFSKEVQCVKFPCADTYTNSCFACKDPKVDYWTAGECPS